MAAGTARLIWLALVLLMLSGCGLTASRINPGYANLDSLGVSDVDKVMTLSLGSGLLSFAARHTGDDPETQALLGGLEGVRVRIYEINGDARRVAGRMDKMEKRLQSEGWEPVATVREEGETVHMLLKPLDGRIAGLTVLVADESEAVIVNLMGDLRPEMFSDTMVALDLDEHITPQVEVASLP